MVWVRRLAVRRSRTRVAEDDEALRTADTVTADEIERIGADSRAAPSGASARDVGGATSMLRTAANPDGDQVWFRIAEDCRRPSSSARRRTAGSSPVTGKAVRSGGLATRETT